MVCMLLFNFVSYVFFLLCMFRSGYSGSLCGCVYCLCVIVYCLCVIVYCLCVIVYCTSVTGRHLSCT
jgi:hypothetical protein